MGVEKLKRGDKITFPGAGDKNRFGPAPHTFERKHPNPFGMTWIRDAKKQPHIVENARVIELLSE